ncbi:hypothetical protein H311_00387 [Anncaliia algerae PRA109]|nr:hypothetical protein H311_00387 [Anncaliia algerae PRA109]
MLFIFFSCKIFIFDKHLSKFHFKFSRFLTPMPLFYKLIISAANLQSGNQFKQHSPIKKLLLNGTIYFYYPVEMYNGNFHTGTLYKNYFGASYDMCVTNGMDYNFYVENGQNFLKMGFYYAVPESLICSNHYDYCSHNFNPNERIIHYDPLINLNCEPNFNYRMNFCQECRKYYFFLFNRK